MITLANPPVVDVVFPVRAGGGSTPGGAILADHGYMLLAAVSRVLPFVHGNPRVGIHPIRGVLTGSRRLQISPTSRIILRLPADLVGETLPLSGKTMNLMGSTVIVGTPNVRALMPSVTLRSRLVVVKDMLDAASLLAAVRRQLDEAGIAGTAEVPTRRARLSLETDGQGSRDPHLRRTLQVRDKVIAGYAVVVTGLTAEESVCLQENGLGGRRRFGCGIFIPVEER